MKKNELLEKLQIVNSQGLNATIPVSEIIIMISQLEEAEEETKLILKEELMDDFVDAVIDELNSEGTSLIDDYDLEMSGRRTLYRHFLLIPDGSIIEIFEKLPAELSNLNRYRIMTSKN